MADEGNAHLLEVVCRKLRQQLLIDRVLAERPLVFLQAQCSEP